MERTLIKDLRQSIGKRVHIAGWVDVRRDHGKLIFLDIRDRSGTAQVVITPKAKDALEAGKELRSQWVVAIEGEVKGRPENMRTEGPSGSLELVARSINVLSRARELPFELGADLNIETHLDYLPLTMRTERARDILAVQSTIIEAYREALAQKDFTEFQAPGLVGSDAEGGAAVFRIDYYKERVAFLATSPQLYKQIMVGPLERASTFAKVFRAEKSATTRHISESTQMDFEMGFIKSHLDVMAVLEQVIQKVTKTVTEKHRNVFEKLKVDMPLVPTSFPILTLAGAQETIEKAFKVKARGEPDMTPEHERLICEWAAKEKGSDFVFITHFPTKTRAFYTYEDPTEKPCSRSFDLLFRGLEVNSGSQRIHNYEDMLARMKERGLDPKKYSFYLQAFKYGMPPHGGCSTGLERFTMKMLNLSNVREATTFPRDMNRIDVRLSE